MCGGGLVNWAHPTTVFCIQEPFQVRFPDCWWRPESPRNPLVQGIRYRSAESKDRNARKPRADHQFNIRGAAVFAGYNNLEQLNGPEHDHLCERSDEAAIATKILS